MSDYYYHNGRLYSADELQHWKYLKKEKINGKWRYYYDLESWKKDVKDKLGYDERDRMKDAESKHNIAKLKRNIEMEEYKEAKDDYAKAKAAGSDSIVDKLAKDYGYKTKIEKTTNELKSATAQLDSATEEYIQTGLDYIAKKKEYLNTPLGKIDNAANKIKKGAEKISSLFSKLFGKKR